MPEYPQPGGDQRSQQKFLIFDKFKKLNTQAARVGLPDDELAWLENLQPLAENKLQVVPAAAAAAFASVPGNIVLSFYAALNGQDYAILFTDTGAGRFINFTTGNSGQFAPPGTFSTTPDCTTWQADRILINDSIAGYCTWDGSVFVQEGGVSPNIVVTNGGHGYLVAPSISLLVNGAGGVGATLVLPGSWTGTPGPGNQPLTFAFGSGGATPAGYATVVGPSPFHIASITITNPGSGWTSPPAVFLTTTGTIVQNSTDSFLTANGATAHATVDTVNGGIITQIVLDNPGSGFAPTDVVTVSIPSSPGGGAVFNVAFSSSGIVSIVVASNPVPGLAAGTYPLTIDAPPSGGTQAVASAVVTGGNPLTNTITSFVITNPGAGYVDFPSISLPGAPTVFSVTMQPQSITALSVFSGGSGYPPSATLPVLFAGAGGNPQATTTCTTNSSGVVTAVHSPPTTGGSYPFGPSSPLLARVGGGQGATATARPWPTVPAGTTLAVFQGRVWLGGGQLLQWTGTGANAGGSGVPGPGYDDFQAIDASGSLQIVDADLVHAITALRSLNNYLWIVGDQSVKQIGNISVNASNVTLFTILTLSSDQGSIWPKSCISYNRIFLFANPNGIFGVFGSTVQKISDDLDGIFQRATFTQQPQGAIVDLNSKHSAVFLLKYVDPLSSTRSLLLMFDGKKWWLASQGNNLVTILTFPQFASDLNTLFGSLAGTDMTQLFAAPNTPVPFRMQTALSHHGNPLQGKRVVRAGFTADAAGSMTVNQSIDFDLGSDPNAFGVTATSLLVGGANDANNTPVTGAGVYLGTTITGTLANIVLQNAIIEYQETSLWKGA